jgi:hypothetical protein
MAVFADVRGEETPTLFCQALGSLTTLTVCSLFFSFLFTKEPLKSSNMDSPPGSQLLTGYVWHELYM